jgi:HSP20 family protein
MVDLKKQSRPAMPLLAKRLNTNGNDVHSLVRHFFGNDFATEFLREPVTWLPAVEVSETDKEISITAELPGLTEKDINISFEDDVLTLSGEKTEEKKEDRSERGNTQYHLVERAYGAFSRSFVLPSNVDSKNVIADFRDGVLKVRLPKAAEQRPAGRKIPINTST